jgi:hypothetical protein
MSQFTLLQREWPGVFETASKAEARCTPIRARLAAPLAKARERERGA